MYMVCVTLPFKNFFFEILIDMFLFVMDEIWLNVWSHGSMIWHVHMMCWESVTQMFQRSKDAIAVVDILRVLLAVQTHSVHTDNIKELLADIKWPAPMYCTNLLSTDKQICTIDFLLLLFFTKQLLSFLGVCSLLYCGVDRSSLLCCCCEVGEHMPPFQLFTGIKWTGLVVYWIPVLQQYPFILQETIALLTWVSDIDKHLL